MNFKNKRGLLLFCIGYILLIFSVLYVFSYKKEDFFYPEENLVDIYDSKNVNDFVISKYPFQDDNKKNKLITYVNDSIFQKKQLNEEEKILSIFNFYKKHIFDNRTNGVLKDHQEPWIQLHLMLNHDAQPYCVNYSVTYHMLATLAGLKCRLVSLTGNNINHIFTETFLHSKNEWVITDVFYQNVLISLPNQKDIYLNGANYSSNGQCMLINDLCKEFNNATHKKYYLSKAFQFGYPFSKMNKILRILSPTIETISGKNQSTSYKYFFIMFSVYSTIIIGIVIIFLLIKKIKLI